MDMRKVGNRLLSIRKRKGLTQAETAELANISDRTYAEIERGKTNMRVDSLVKICTALHVSPNDILFDDIESSEQSDLLATLNALPAREKETALSLLSVYLQSLNR